MKNRSANSGNYGPWLVGLGAALTQTQLAKREARTAAAVQAFLQDIFKASSSDQADPIKSRQLTARELLDVGAKKIDTALADEPAAQSQVLGTLAEMYTQLRASDQAVELLRKRVEVIKKVHGPVHPDVAAAHR